LFSYEAPKNPHGSSSDNTNTQGDGGKENRQQEHHPKCPPGQIAVRTHSGDVNCESDNRPAQVANTPQHGSSEQATVGNCPKEQHWDPKKGCVANSTAGPLSVITPPPQQQRIRTLCVPMPQCQNLKTQSVGNGAAGGVGQQGQQPKCPPGQIAIGTHSGDVNCECPTGQHWDAKTQSCIAAILAPAIQTGSSTGQPPQHTAGARPPPPTTIPHPPSSLPTGTHTGTVQSIPPFTYNQFMPPSNSSSILNGSSLSHKEGRSIQAIRAAPRVIIDVRVIGGTLHSNDFRIHLFSPGVLFPADSRGIEGTSLDDFRIYAPVSIKLVTPRSQQPAEFEVSETLERDYDTVSIGACNGQVYAGQSRYVPLLINTSKQ